MASLSDATLARFADDDERYRALVQASGQMSWTMPADGMATGEQRAWCAYTGQEPKEITGSGWLDAVHPDERAAVTAGWLAAVDARVLYEAVVRVRRADGIYRTCLLRGLPVLKDGGAVREWLGFCTDMTAQQDAQAERERVAAREADARAARLEAVFNAIADSMYVYDRDGHLVQTNAAALYVNPLSGDPDYLARPFAERIAVFDVHTAQGAPIAVEDLPVSRVLRGEVLTGSHAEDTTMHTPDGRDILLNTSGAPVRDADGAITGAVIVSRDVTERRRLVLRTQVALDALLEIATLLILPQERQETAQGQSHASIFDTPYVGQRLADLTMLVLGCKRVALAAAARRGEPLRPLAAVGMTPEEERRWRAGEPNGAYLRESMPPDYFRRLQAGEVLLIDYTQPPFDTWPNPHAMQTLLLAPMHVEGDLVGILNADFGGEAHTYTEQELRLVWAVARFGALVIERERLLHERGEAQASELALRKANQVMDEFLGIASHELRTPLAIFLANVQIAGRRMERLQAQVEQRVGKDDSLATPIAAVQGLLMRAETAALRQDRLVSDLLDVSRIQSGKLDIRPERIELGQTVRQCVEEQRLAYPGRSIVLELPEAETFVLGDGDRVGQVLTNYLSNALKYSAEEKPVVVLLRRDGQYARVEVRDEGPGLPPEEQARIWERFYRVPGVEHRSGSGVGLGLGLHISKTMVERHGGQVGVESVPGDGATFWFTLPLAPDADA